MKIEEKNSKMKSEKEEKIFQRLQLREETYHLKRLTQFIENVYKIIPHKLFLTTQLT